MSRTMQRNRGWRGLSLTAAGLGLGLGLAPGAAWAQTVSTGYTWHPTLPLPTQIVEAGLTTDLTYDNAGRLLRLTQTDTTSQSAPYATAGRKRVWTYSYGIGNRVTAVDGPLPGSADTLTYTYSDSGNLQTVTDPVGLTTTVTAWNERGQPTAVTDPNGLVTSYTYDGLGRVIAIVRDPGPRQQRWRMTYTLAGDLESLEEPTGKTLTLTWDGARRLVGIANNAGEQTTYERDALGGVIRRTLTGADGAIAFEESGTFDELGRLIQQVGGEARSWSFTYDRTDKLTGLTDPRGQTLGRGYDGLGRLFFERERDGGKVVHGYNAKGEATSYTDPGSLTTAYVRNGFGEVIQEVSPDRGTSVFDHDERGLVIRKVDGRGFETTYAYDAAGRLTARAPADAALSVNLTYDDTRDGNAGRGRLTGMQDASGTSAYAYDAHGHMVRETRTIAGAVTRVAYSYDRAGRLMRLIYPSGRRVEYGYDALGRVTTLSLWHTSVGPAETLLSDIAYLPEGPLRQATFGNGLALARDFDREYRIARLTVTRPDSSLVLGRSYVVGDGLNLTEIVEDDDAGGHDVMALHYDAAGRLAGAGRLGESWDWSYDLTGNRQAERHTGLSGATQRAYTYAAGTNRLNAVTADGARERGFTYDPAGNLIRDERGATSVNYAYDAAGHLARVGLGRLDRARAAYTSDGRRRLAIRTLVDGVPDGTTHWIYDFADRLIAETDASGTTLREYVWLDDLPVAVLDATRDPANPVLLFVHADHLARPVAMTDADGAVVWQASYDPFGAVKAITGPASLDLRFPGQWFQLETGLHYNWHRHYDPSTGRYTTPDPLGFVDGPSVYAYVNSDPLQKVDASGLLAGPVTPRGDVNKSNSCDQPASLIHRVNNDCGAEWAIARARCASYILSPNPPRGITGGYSSVEKCARGLVSERCGGNPIDYGLRR